MRCGTPVANSRFSRPRAISPSASEGTLPCSAVRCAAISRRCASTRLRIRNMTSVRFESDVARQPGKAALAAATAASTSSTEAKSTSRATAPVAGLKTGPRRSGGARDAPTIDPVRHDRARRGGGTLGHRLCDLGHGRVLGCWATGVPDTIARVRRAAPRRRSTAPRRWLALLRVATRNRARRRSTRPTIATRLDEQELELLRAERPDGRRVPPRERDQEPRSRPQPECHEQRGAVAARDHLEAGGEGDADDRDANEDRLVQLGRMRRQVRGERAPRPGPRVDGRPREIGWRALPRGPEHADRLAGGQHEQQRERDRMHPAGHGCAEQSGDRGAGQDRERHRQCERETALRRVDDRRWVRRIEIQVIEDVAEPAAEDRAGHGPHDREGQVVHPQPRRRHVRHDGRRHRPDPRRQREPDEQDDREPDRLPPHRRGVGQLQDGIKGEGHDRRHGESLVV